MKYIPFVFVMFLVSCTSHNPVVKPDFALLDLGRENPLGLSLKDVLLLDIEDGEQVQPQMSSIDGRSQNHFKSNFWITPGYRTVDFAIISGYTTKHTIRYNFIEGEHYKLRAIHKFEGDQAFHYGFLMDSNEKLLAKTSVNLSKRHQPYTPPLYLYTLP